MGTSMNDQLILDDVKVADFTWWAAGPFTTKYLADFGATIVKVESPKRPDLFRVAEPYRRDCKPGPDRSGLFIQANTGKYSMCLDISKAKGLEVAKKLIAWADVVCENFSPGTMDRMGLGFEELKRVNQDIIMVSCSVAGGKGIWPPIRGHAGPGTALSGFYDLTGYADGEPTIPSLGVADVAQALLAVVVVLSALDYRRKTETGQLIDISQIETMSYFIAPAILDYEVNGRVQTRMGNRDPNACPHGAFRCRGEDRWCAIAISNEEEWQSLWKVIGDPRLLQDERFSTSSLRKKYENELEKLITEWTSELDADEVADRLQSSGIPAGVVKKVNELFDDAHIRARELFQPMKHPVLGECQHPAPAVKLSHSPFKLRTAPCLGEHTAYVCTSLLGISDEEFAKLMNQGVFG